MTNGRDRNRIMNSGSEKANATITEAMPSGVEAQIKYFAGIVSKRRSQG